MGEGELGPHLTMWPGPRHTCMPSFVLIRPTVWPQYTNVTDRTDRQTEQDRQDRTDMTDNGLIAYGEPFCKQSPKNPIRLKYSAGEPTHKDYAVGNDVSRYVVDKERIN